MRYDFGRAMRKLARFLAWTAVIVGALIGLARGFLLRWWTVPENDPYLEASVAPTLEGGDVIILWRATKPSFGDLVMCPEPNAPGRMVIGRLYGEEGDDITVDGDRVIVNGKASGTERSCTEQTFVAKEPRTGREVTQPCSVEELAGHTSMRGGRGDSKLAPQQRQTKVAPGKVYLVSDNRLFPYDSRDFGTVERASCAETVLFRLVGRNGFFDDGRRFEFLR